MLIRQIEAFMRQTKMPQTKFGRLAVNDPRLVRDLRNGRELGRRISARIAAYLDEAGA